jgi:hypothetical protein
MPKFAQFDSTQTAITPVIGWYDTDEFDYPNLPAAANLYECTDAEWAERTAGWGINPTAATKSLLAYVPAVTLAQAQAAQIAVLAAEYQTAIVQPVSFTSKAGVTKTFQADAASVANLTSMLLGFQAAAATPAGFYWLSVDNTQVPFTYADMQGLAAAFAAQGAAAFFVLQTKKAAVLAATSVAAAQAIS